MEKLLKDSEFIKWVINQGVSFVILLTFTVSFMYLSFTYVPKFVDHVGNLAASTEKIDMHLADMVHDTAEIKAIDQGLVKKVQSIQNTVNENNILLKQLKR